MAHCVEHLLYNTSVTPLLLPDILKLSFKRLLHLSSFAEKAKEETLIAESCRSQPESINVFNTLLAPVPLGDGASCAEVAMLSNAEYMRIFFARVGSSSADLRASAASQLKFLHGVEFSYDEVCATLFYCRHLGTWVPGLRTAF